MAVNLRHLLARCATKHVERKIPLESARLGYYCPSTPYQYKIAQPHKTLSTQSNQTTSMPKSKTFEERYPSIHRFVEEIGSIEIGQHEMISSFARAYDLGGTVYEGEDSYPSLEAALQDLEAGIKSYLNENGI